MRTTIAAAVAAALAVSCTHYGPRFGSLEADRRTFKVQAHVHLFQLTNGMTVALAPDSRTNLVSVDVRYLVGSADDPIGRSGLAHLVEHLAFDFPSGSQGATLWDKLSSVSLDQNAYTNKDVTHYVSIALASRVDALLELEGQRLAGRCDELDDATFVRERDVVLEEEAQRQSPVGAAITEIDAEVWGPHHPYGRPIGSREVAAATKAEACAFFHAHYTPDRAIMVVTGSFDPDVMQQRIGRRFGPITTAPAAARVEVAPPQLDGGKSEHRADVDHPLALIYLPAPSWGAPGEAVHEMLMMALQGELADLDDRESWLVSAFVGYGFGGEGRQRTMVIALEVSDAAYLDRAVDAALSRGRDLFLDDDRDGNNDDYNDDDDGRVVRYIGAIRGELQTDTITRLDRIIGRGSWLADYLTYTNHTAFMLATMNEVQAVTGEALVRGAHALFDRKHAHVALIRPSGDGTTSARALVAASAQDYDLAPWRTAIDPADAARPLSMPPDTRPLAVDDYTLANGVRVLLYADPQSPVVDARLVYAVGDGDEEPTRPGVATLATYLLGPDFGTIRTTATFDTIRWASGIGNRLQRSLDSRTTTFRSSGLAAFGDWHVWWLSWLLDQGGYSSASVDAIRRNMREAQTGKDRSASDLAFRERLYGAAHPLAVPVPTVEQLTAIGADELATWRRRHFATRGATLIVTGGFEPAKMRREIDELFAPWAATWPLPRQAPPPPQPAAGPSWIRTDKADATQVTMRIGFTARSDAGRSRAARLVLTAMVDDRLRVIREGMGASYGVSVGYDRGALAIETALDPVRAPKAAAAMLAELEAIHAGAATMPSDFARARRRVFARMLATRTDATSVANDLLWMIANDLTIDQLNGLAAEIAQLTPAQVAAVAAGDLDPTRMVVSIAGRTGPVDAIVTALGATGVARFAD